MHRIRATTLALGLFLAIPLHIQGQVGENLGLVNPNLATVAELTAVDGLSGPAAEAIVAERPYLDMASLHAVVSRHVSAGDIETVYRGMWVPIDLNAATKDEIMLIPGVGERMHHEFEEYRPYPALARFHREIAKYVDDAELARLEQYVYVRIDLNSASEEAILTIPGVGERMKHEFEEYRPYRDLAQFRREMGKYVDEDEVARLERYVRLNP